MEQGVVGRMGVGRAGKKWKVEKEGWQVRRDGGELELGEE